MNQIVTFGELMMRLATNDNECFSQARTLGLTFGGGEFNVCVSLKNYGLATKFVSRLPDNPIGKSALEEIHRFKINTDHLLFGGDRLGIYFLEKGAGLRPSKVIYDRNNSALATKKEGMFDWDAIFDGVTWFHWSGVTPALSQGAADVVLEALKIAKSKGIKISCDLNYRSKLWKYGKHPKDIMPELLTFSNVILGDIDTACYMTGKNPVNPDYNNTETLPDLYSPIFDLCPDLEHVATSLRNSLSTSHQRIGGILYDKKSIYRAANYEVDYVVDRVGSGDAFMAGLIYGICTLDKKETIEFATAACALKHTIQGDLNRVSVADVQKLIDGVGDVQR